VQMLAATGAGAGLARLCGWSWPASLVTGVAVSVASTVVLIRVLGDNHALHEEPGRIAVGWLIVEDIVTVVILVLIPAAAATGQGGGAGGLVTALGLTVVRLAVLIVLILGVGGRVVPALLRTVARTGSRELFTLAVLSIALALAAGSTVLFGASMALGAFLAGVVAGQSELSEQAAADALPMRDAFGVIFFVSVGMLFDPTSLGGDWPVTLAMLFVILIVKPVVAAALVLSRGYSVRAALLVGVGLGQIGEFSFIVADTARHLKLVGAGPGNVLTVAALVSIGLNPLLFRAIGPIERALRSWPWIWSRIHARSERQRELLNAAAGDTLSQRPEERVAVVVGYGPMGQTLAQILRNFGLRTVVVELNVDTVARLMRAGVPAIFGDAGRVDILDAAGLRRADYLVITPPDPAQRIAVVTAARGLNPDVIILARARYVTEREELEALGVHVVGYEELEVAVRLAKELLRRTGADEEAVRSQALAIRSGFDVRHA
jgi:CPA2 family monovalent cation:H+ antiporter-2